MPFSDASTTDLLLQFGRFLGISLAFLLICFIPGWSAARRLSPDPEIRSLASSIISFVLMYAAAFGVYLLNVDRLWAVAALAIASIPSLWALKKDGLGSLRAPRELLLVWLCACLLFIAPQIFIFAPGAPTGMWDWVEHWARAKIFLNGEGLDTKVGGYSMAARGPLFNAISTFFMCAFKNDSYWGYQIVSNALNTWYVLPLTIALKRFCGIARNWSIVFALLVGFIRYDIGWSIIYPWTKIFTVGLLLASIVIYRQGLLEDDNKVIAFGLGGFSVAFLSHYFAFPCAVFFWGHYAVTRLLKAPKLCWKTAAIAMGSSAALVSSWFLACFAKLGVGASLAANTTVGTFYTNTQSGVLPAYYKVLIFNLIATLSPVNIEAFLGIDTWVPKVANWIATFNVVHWHDGREVHHQEIPSWVSRTFFSGVFSGFSTPVGIMVLAILAYGLFQLRRRSPQALVFGSKFWILFWTVGVMMHAATSRDYSPGGVGILWLYNIFLFMAVFWTLTHLPSSLRLFSLGVLTTVGLKSLLNVVIIQSEPITIVNGQAQAALNAKVFSWHIQNCTMKAQNQAVLLYDLFGNDRVTMTIALLGCAVAVLAWILTSEEAPIPCTSTEQASQCLH